MSPLPAFRTWSLKTKFALFSGALMGVFSIAFTTWTLHNVESDVHASVVDAQRALVRSTAADIDAKVELRQDALRTIAPLLAQAAPAPGAPMDAFFKPRPVLRKMFDIVLVADAQGQVLYEFPAGAAAAAIGSGLAGSTHFKAAMGGEPVVISSPFKSAAGATPYVAFTSPLRGNDGQVRGALIGLLNLHHGNFIGDLDQIPIGKAGYFLLVERKDQPLFVLHRKPELIAMPAPGGSTHPIITGASQGSEGEIEGPGASGIVALRTFKALRTVPWVLVALYPVNEAFAGLQARRQEVLGVGAALFLLASVAAWLLTGWLLRPLEQLRHDIGRHAADPGLKLAPERFGSVELADLVVAYNAQASARREFENRLHASEKRVRAIADHLPALIAHVDREERYDFLNATFKTWLGIDPAASVGKRMAEVIGGEVYATRRERVARCLAGEASSFEMDVVTLVGRKTLRIEYLPDVEADGSIAGLYTFSADVTELKDVQLRLDKLVRSDSLTGLSNRLQFEETLQAALARSGRHASGMALMFLDIDHFKQINDCHGHAIGDQVLQAFAGRLRLCVRASDTVARLGGDEFVVILDGVPAAADAERVGQSIVHAMQAPFDTGAMAFTVTASIGIAFRAGLNSAAPGPAFLKAADAALYVAKSSGRNRYHRVDV